MPIPVKKKMKEVMGVGLCFNILKESKKFGWMYMKNIWINEVLQKKRALCIYIYLYILSNMYCVRFVLKECMKIAVENGIMFQYRIRKLVLM